MKINIHTNHGILMAMETGPGPVDPNHVYNIASDFFAEQNIIRTPDSPLKVLKWAASIPEEIAKSEEYRKKREKIGDTKPTIEILSEEVIVEEKTQALIWDDVSKSNKWEDTKILHWGISYVDLGSGAIGHSTTVFVRLLDGTVKEVYPTNIRFVKEEIES